MPPSNRIDNFSYATPDDPRLKRLLIRVIERMTGQPYLKRLYDEHRTHPSPGENFWAASIRRLELKVVCNEDALARLPRTGPLVIVANHPFGVLDGLIISYLTSKVRDDFLVLTNSVLYQADEIRAHLLPIDFAETKEALGTNLKSRATAKAHLVKGGCLVVFPAGGASTAPKPWSRRAVDAEWKNFTARLIVSAKAPVVPVYFAGQNSRLFQIASHISLTLRLSLFFKEVYDKIGSEIHVRVGEIIPYKELEKLDRKDIMEHLRKATYALGASLPDAKIRGKRPSRKRSARKST
ncbi:MAG TPA: lysophospholipid acyltransferase family protein [Micropepsaceae bacterium]|nr:lysophospholipid acyltransferase family protein [Micropepsaceae bacterium]